MERVSHLLRIRRDIRKLLGSQVLSRVKGHMLYMASAKAHEPNGTKGDLLGQMLKKKKEFIVTTRISPTDCLLAVC